MNEARNQTSIRAETVPSHGNGKQPPVVEQTPEELTFAQDMAHYRRVIKERDELQKVIDRQEQMLTVARIEAEGLRAELAAAQSRIASYQHDRDDAVANLGVYQTLFISFQAQMRAFSIEHQPLVKNAPAS